MRPHFKLNVLEVDMVSFTEAFLLLAREGWAKILNTLYFESSKLKICISLSLQTNCKHKCVSKFNQTSYLDDPCKKSGVVKYFGRYNGNVEICVHYVNLLESFKFRSTKKFKSSSHQKDIIFRSLLSI